jgi:hypothetical protein
VGLHKRKGGYMSKTIEVEVFKYDELSDSAKQKAREWYLEGMDYEWWEGVYEMAKEDGKEKGFYIDKIFFSGFCSQGDGASWTGQVDVRQWLEENCSDSIGLSAWCQLIQEGVVSKFVKVDANNAHYCHESTMQFSDIEDDGFMEDAFPLVLPSIFQGMSIANLFDIIATDTACPYKGVDEITQAITESGKDYARDIYQRLREEYEYLCSDEMMLDHFDCNDYHFTNEGALA